MNKLDVRIEDSRWNDTQRHVGVADFDLMAGVIAAAETRNDVVVRGVQVDDATFTLIAPLNAYNNIRLSAHAAVVLRSRHGSPVTVVSWA